MTYRVRNIVIALGLALVAMMLTLFYVTNYKRSVQHGESQVKVWVAARDIPAGTSGAELAKSKAFKTTQIPKRSVVAGAISDTQQIDQLVLSQPLYAGEQVTVRRFQTAQSQGIVGQLKATMRAISLPGDADQLLAGTLKTGDHVDVVANFKLTNIQGASGDYFATRIVLRDLLVLHAPEIPASAKVTTDAKTSVVVAVTDTQVQRLYFVMQNAAWTLELRPVVDAQDSSERMEGNISVLTDGISNAQWNHFLEGNVRNLR